MNEEGLINYLLHQNLAKHSKFLECFARTGEWLTKDFLKISNNITCMEIEPKYIQKLKENFQNGKILNVDSVHYIDNISDRFDVISMDNPQGVYGAGYCEHFEILDKVHKVMKSKCFLIFNINIKPFDVNKTSGNVTTNDNYGSDYNEWMNRRRRYYNSQDENTSIDFFAKYYTNFFTEKGFRVSDIRFFMIKSSVEGLDDNLARCVVKIS